MTLRSPDSKFGWELKNDVDFGFAVADYIVQVASEQMRDLADLFPFRENWNLSIRFGETWFAAKLQGNRGTGLVPYVGGLSDKEWLQLEGAIAPFEVRRHGQLSELLDKIWFSDQCFTYVGPHCSRYADWSDVQRHVVDWLNQHVVGGIMQLNRTRILRVIPEPPSFDIDAISGACWIIECEETCTQGSGFALEGVGLVTCAHAIGPKSVAFQTNDINKRFQIEVICKHDTVDLAVAKLPESISGVLSKGSADQLKLQDHIGIAGFPNYRFGESVQFRTGTITGFRQVSGIRRPLTNAGIVRGNSGGPVLGRGKVVVGVAVTGGDSIVVAERTEDQGIIPIDALSYLK